MTKVIDFSIGTRNTIVLPSIETLMVEIEPLVL